MLDELIKKLIDSLENGNWLIALVVIAIAIIVNLKDILEFLERQGNKKEEFIKEALKIDSVKGAARTFIEEELNYLIFKKVTGISADKVFREKVKEIIEKAEGELQFFQVARARKHLSVKEGKIIVKLSGWDRVEYYFNWVVAANTVVFGLLFLILPTTIKGLTIYQFAVFFFVSIISFFFSVFLAGQTMPFSEAKRIQPLIERVQQ